MASTSLFKRVLAPAVTAASLGLLVLAPAASAEPTQSDDREGKSASPASSQQSPKPKEGAPGKDAGGQSGAPNGSNGNLHTSVSNCTLTAVLRGFDSGVNQVVITIVDKRTDARLVRDAFTATFPTRTNGNTVDTTRSYTLSGAHHVKVTAEVTSAKGTATKHKVEWIRCGDAATAARGGKAATAGTAGGRAAVAGASVLGATVTRDASTTGKGAPAAVAGRSVRAASAGGAVGAAAKNDVAVLGAEYARGQADDSPAAFALTGLGLVRLLALALTLLLAGGAAVWATRRSPA